MNADTWTSEDVEHDSPTSRKIATIISVLLPAREYKLECSWTNERPLPAIEEFACKLLLVLGEIGVAELKGYFGLSDLEVDGLVKSLLAGRLVELNDLGLLMPSTMLQAKGAVEGEVPALTTFETRDEVAAFDLLTLQLVPRRGYGNARYGLPELEIPEGSRSVHVDRIAESFSSQYRAYLDYSREKSADLHKTRLYKVSRCSGQRTLQVPVDLEVSMEVGPDGELRTYREAVERLGENRKRPLTNELEAMVADFLGAAPLDDTGASFGEFVRSIGDEVLLRYVRGREPDLGSWLSDRERGKTGYGSPLTRGIFGPIYLRSNRMELLRLLKESSAGDCTSAYWLPAKVPFWGANSSELTDFTHRFQEKLGGKAGRIVACFSVADASEQKELKRRYHSRIPHAAGFWGGGIQDRCELLVVPGRLAVAQYHVRAQANTAVTVPLGFATIDPIRIERVMAEFAARLAPARRASLLWARGGGSEVLTDFVDFPSLGLEEFAVQSAARSAEAAVSWKKSRL